MAKASATALAAALGVNEVWLGCVLSKLNIEIMPNGEFDGARLIQLLQAGNLTPKDWYEWCTEEFQKLGFPAKIEQHRNGRNLRIGNNVLPVYLGLSVKPQTNQIGFSVARGLSTETWYVFIVAPLLRIHVRPSAEVLRAIRTGREQQKAAYITISPGVTKDLLQNRVLELRDWLGQKEKGSII